MCVGGALSAVNGFIRKGMLQVQDDFSTPMTVISSKAFQAAIRMDLSAQDAAEALLNAVQIRSFMDTLRHYVPEADLRSLLVDGLCANDPSRSRASVDRKVRGWLGGAYQPTAREDLLELCFVLRLDVENADAFLAAVGEEGMHWRDPRELVYAFALREGMRYPEAQALYGRVKPDEDAGGADATESFTPLVHQEAAQLETEEELAQYLKQAARRLGSLHNSAYQQFLELMSVLERPDSSTGDEEDRYTMRDIVETYLDKKLPSARQGKSFGEKRRGILAGWPDEATLSRMKNRKTDVTRKVLMLLFLVTDGGEPEEEEWPDDEDLDWDEMEDEDEGNEADAAFRSSYMRMNQMLASCGYRTIDPRNPFDWVALYCMRVQEDDESIDGLNERLSHVLDALFAMPEPEA